MQAWTRTAREDGGLGEGVSFPLVADITKDISRNYGVLTTDVNARVIARIISEISR